MTRKIHEIDHGQLNSESFKKLQIGVVVSKFNRHFCEVMEQSAVDELLLQGVVEESICIVRVPGALEIPSALQELAETGRFDALIALGVVVKGETYHFEVVSLKSAEGVLSVALDQRIPIANGVLTVNTDEQAQARVDIKARECARTALEMAMVYGSIENF
jgi:6,7-dimethyl-8-ribityllumazine synthase